MSILSILNEKKNKDKKLTYILNQIYGLNNKKIKTICTTLQYDPNVKLCDMKEKDVMKLNNLIKLKYKFIILIDLKNLKKKHINTNININSYKGIRYHSGLPVNGQNTHNNSRTARKLWKIS